MNCGERIVAGPQVSEIQGRFQSDTYGYSRSKIVMQFVKGQKSAKRDAGMRSDANAVVSRNRDLAEIADTYPRTTEESARAVPPGC